MDPLSKTETTSGNLTAATTGLKCFETDKIGRVISLNNFGEDLIKALAAALGSQMDCPGTPSPTPFPTPFTLQPSPHPTHEPTREFVCLLPKE